MRADAHYVDQLVVPAARRVSDEEPRPAAAAPKSASVAVQPRGESTMLNEDELAKSLSAVLSCADLITDGVPKLTRSVAIDMIRAEAQRGICAVRGAQIVKQGVPMARQVLRPRAVLEDVASAVDAETRLRGSRVTVTAEVPDAIRIAGDKDTLVTALSGVVILLSAGLHDVQGARLDLKTASDENGRVTFTIAQESVILPDAYLKIVSAAHDGALVTAETSPLVALRQVAEAYGGHLAVTRLPRGTQVAVELPTEA
jgi:hypothetical protein